MFRFEEFNIYGRNLQINPQQSFKINQPCNISMPGFFRQIRLAGFALFLFFIYTQNHNRFQIPLVASGFFIKFQWT